MTVTLDYEKPSSASTSNPVDSSIAFTLSSDIPGNPFLGQDNNIVVSLVISGVPGSETIYTAGKVTDRYTGSVRIDTETVDNRASICGSFTRNSRLPYNSTVQITIDGIELTPLPVPFSKNYSFNTVILSDIFPSSDTPAEGDPPDNAPVEGPISFKINTNWPTLLYKNLINATISWSGMSPPNPLPVIVAGVCTSYPFKATVFPDSASSSSGYSVLLERLSDCLPYDTIVTVAFTLTGVGSQTFDFKTVSQYVDVDEIGNESISSIQNSYTSIKDDGATYGEEFTGALIEIIADPNHPLPEDQQIDVLSDTENSPFSIEDVGKTIKIESPVGNNIRVTTIKEYLDADKVKLDSKGVVFSLGSVTSYTIYYKVVKSATSMQAVPAGSGSSDDLVKSSTNGIFLAVQNWTTSLSAYKKTFFRNDLISWSDSDTDWAVNYSASSTTDPSHSSLRVHSFPDSADRGIGFYLHIPEGAKGMRLSIRGRAETEPEIESVVGFRLYTQKVPTNSALPGWTNLILDSMVVATNDYYQEYSTNLIFSELGSLLTAGDFYELELARIVTVSPNLVGNFLLLELSVDFG